MSQDVTAGILRKNGSVLIARRAHGRHAGKWEFPGGKVEVEETAEECLRRELHEEFGVDVTIGQFLVESIYEYEFGVIRLIAYNVTIDKGNLNPVDHDKIEWVQPDHLLNYDLLPADIPIAMFLNELSLTSSSNSKAFN